jgi:predicted transglutaminase-like cysteine proteinase
MRLLFIIFIFIFISYSTEFIDDKLIKDVEEKYGIFAKNRFQSLQKLILELQDKEEKVILEKVNDFFNKVDYSTDEDTYDLKDYWATPFEFLARDEGDCEDYAIAKYLLLKHLGINSNKMYLTYVNLIHYDASHMVLSYFETQNSVPLILDNFEEELLPATQRTDLKPVHYFNPEILKDGMKTSSHKKWDQLIKNMMEKKI